VSERIQLERLSPLDTSNLRVEDRGVSMHVAALVVLDRTPLGGSSPQVRLDAVRASSRAACISHRACAISAGAFSYAGQLNLGIVADRDAVPDLAAFTGGITDALEQLGVLAEARGTVR
jgi:hypothetical protein